MFPNLGLEPTLELYIEHMVEIFREVRRVLRDDGCCWLNYGDCYIDGNLAMMPHRVAIALQADGWIVRNDCCWKKPNPMPESVNGERWENGKLRKGSWRHTRAHEYIFMLCKYMKYFCDQEAVRETSLPQSYRRAARGKQNKLGKGIRDDGASHNKRGAEDVTLNPAGRNPRSVLDVPTQSYKGAHYATFPERLIAPLIRAACPKRCCPECGAAWAPVVEKTQGKPQHSPGGDSEKIAHETARGKHGATSLIYTGGGIQTNVIDYRPTCSCGCRDHIPGIVLDPFIGSGTTGAVARELGRRWVGLDISYEYLDQQAKIRALNWTPSNALEDLPLFGGLSAKA